MRDAPYQLATHTLENGLTVSTVEMPHLHSTTISLFVRVGSRHETPETNGLTHFMEHMLFRGCAGYPDSTALNMAMVDLGGTLDGSTMRELSSYHSTVHPDYVGEGMDIIGSMFTSPSFRDIDIERSIILEEILDSLDERGRVIELDTIAHREAFRGHPLGQSIDGPRKNLRRFSVADLEKHRQRFLGAENMVLCVAGRLDPGKVLVDARRTFGKLPRGKRVKETAPALPSDAPRFTYVRADDTQTRVRMSFRTVHDQHPDYPALVLLRRVLDGGLSSRLQVELVEKRGIAYDVSADLETYADCGLLDFELAVAHKKLPYAFEELTRVIREMVTDGVAPDELARTQRRARIGLELVLDSAYDLGTWFGSTQLYRAPLTPEARIAQLEQVTADAVRKVAEKYLSPRRMTVAAVGNAPTATVRAARTTIARFVEEMS